MDNLIVKNINGKQYIKVLHCCFPIWLEANETGDGNLEGVFVKPAIFLSNLIPGLGIQEFENGQSAFKFLPYEKGDFWLKVLFKSFIL